MCVTGKLDLIADIVFSLIVGIIFVIFSTPLLYRCTNYLTNLVGLETQNDNSAPTWFGIFLHAFLFSLLFFLFINNFTVDKRKHVHAPRYI